jgi:hypothetical protein
LTEVIKLQQAPDVQQTVNGGHFIVCLWREPSSLVVAKNGKILAGFCFCFSPKLGEDNRPF